MSKLQRGIKSLKSIVAIGAAICCSASAWAASEFIDGNGLKWTYTASSGKATLSNVVKADGSALTGTLTIPATINGATVTAIGVNAFQNLGITKVQFPEGITTINYGAFADCTALESLTLPDSLTTIGGGGYSGRGAFNGCTALKSVTFGAGLVTLSDGRNDNSIYNPEEVTENGTVEIDPIYFEKKKERMQFVFRPSVKKMIQEAASEEGISVNAYIEKLVMKERHGK